MARGQAAHSAARIQNIADSDPSWRWDEKHAKARCTCGTASIFDVIMKIEGLDFEAAKLRAAEILGLDELIEEASEAPRFQATDAASLLAAPPDQRDDKLPLAYLAHRLGVDADAVPPPTTPYVGLKALAYFDAPPPGSKAKPKPVGSFPCAVFGTLSADGRRHAHRIYVAPGGAGKAELGTAPNGRPRDPKKSAKVVGEQSTAGCAVLWGDPAQAPHLLLAEGIETAAAVALAVLPEITRVEWRSQQRSPPSAWRASCPGRRHSGSPLLPTVTRRPSQMGARAHGAASRRHAPLR